MTAADGVAHKTSCNLCISHDCIFIFVLIYHLLDNHLQFHVLPNIPHDFGGVGVSCIEKKVGESI